MARYLYAMRKLVAIFLFFFFFFGATDAYQLLKLPKFAEHYYLHKQQNSNLTLAGFLQIHYYGPVVVDDDFDKDMQLPFKTTQIEFSQTINIIAPPINYSLQATPAFSPAKFSPYKQVVASFITEGAVFQPPRLL